MSWFSKRIKKLGKWIDKTAHSVVGEINRLGDQIGDPWFKEPNWRPPNNDVEAVQMIADVLASPTADFSNVKTKHYVTNSSSAWVAKYLGISLPPESSVLTTSNVDVNQVRPIFPAFGRGKGFSGITIGGKIRPFVNPKRALDYRKSADTCSIMALAEKISEFAGLAQAAGFDPPDNPFNLIASLNAQRSKSMGVSSDRQLVMKEQLQLTPDLAGTILFNIRAYITLLEAYNQGAIDFKKGKIDVAQLSHLNISFEGHGGSGNVAADVLSFLPATSLHEKEAARKALEALDFKKRKPYLLFTLDYVPVNNGKSEGTLVGWKKISDASGYIITRRSVFKGEEKTFEFDSKVATNNTVNLLPYVKTYALSFLNKLDDKTVLVFKDTDVVRDEIYIYKVQAYQIKVDLNAPVLSMQTRPAKLTATQQLELQNKIKEYSGWKDVSIVGTATDGSPIKVYNNFKELTSPWPAFSQVIFGDPSYDWLLAAVNTRAAIDRKEPNGSVRGYSYISSNSGYLLAMSSADKLVKPVDKAQAANLVETAIQNFGISQVIQSLFNETGISYYFEGMDPPETTVFHRAGQDPDKKIFQTVLSAIDSDTATIDLNVLASNMSILLNQPWGKTELNGGNTPSNNNPTEITVPNAQDIDATVADGPLQFINQLGDLRDGVVDLTTFDGIGKLMRAVRLMSDFSANRNPSSPPTDGSNQEQPPVVPDPKEVIGQDNDGNPLTREQVEALQAASQKGAIIVPSGSGS